MASIFIPEPSWKPLLLTNLCTSTYRLDNRWQKIFCHKILKLIGSRQQEENVSAICGLSCFIKKKKNDCSGGKMTRSQNTCRVNLRTWVSVLRNWIKMSVKLAHAYNPSTIKTKIGACGLANKAKFTNSSVVRVFLSCL